MITNWVYETSNPKLGLVGSRKVLLNCDQNFSTTLEMCVRYLVSARESIILSLTKYKQNGRYLYK